MYYLYKLLFKAPIIYGFTFFLLLFAYLRNKRVKFYPSIWMAVTPSQPEMLVATCKWSLLNSSARAHEVSSGRARCRFRWNMRDRPSRKIYERQNLWAIIMHSAFRRVRIAPAFPPFSRHPVEAILYRKWSSLSLIHGRERNRGIR